MSGRAQVWGLLLLLPCEIAAAQTVDGSWEAMASPGSSASITDDGGSKRIDLTLAAPFGWAGAVVLTAPGAWGSAPGPSLALSDAERLRLRARGGEGGERVRLRAAVAGDQPYGDSAALPLDSGWITLSTSWQPISLPVAGRDLSRVITPFALIANRQHNPDGRVTVYIDSLRYDTPNPGDPVALPDGQPAFLRFITDPRSALVAYTPSGVDPRQPPDAAGELAERIAADLAALRPAFNGLILYAFHSRLTPLILDAAIAGGWKAVLLGLWDPKSEAEIEGLAAAIRRHHRDLALAVCIGNEGINDNRYGIADLAWAAARLRERMPDGLEIPVTTSEPAADYGWSALSRFGDFLAPNIHPALDRPGLSPTSAAGLVRQRAIALASATGKSVFVKETGWPRDGGGAFGADRQAEFWIAYLRNPRLVWLDDPPLWVSFAPAFEAFDAPWKVAAFGSAAEGSWGLFDVHRRPYPAFAAWRNLGNGR